MPSSSPPRIYRIPTSFLDDRFTDFINQGAVGVAPQPRLWLEQERIHLQGAADVIGEQQD